MRDLLRVLCKATGVGGVGTVAQTLQELIRPYADDVYMDTLGNVIAVRNCDVPQAQTVMLEAHMDEIGFVVTRIDDQGFIYTAPCGGVDPRVLAATPVEILCDPPINGVFCSVPPHLAGNDKELPTVDALGIDTGLPCEVVKERVAIGTRGAFSGKFRTIGEHLVCSKALDNRAGCAAVLKAFMELSRETLPYRVAAAFTVQEEIGGAGSIAGAFGLHPSVAFVTDVSFASTPDAPAHECGELGKGPMLGISPFLCRRLTTAVESTANRHGIHIQYEAMGGGTGTDADKLQTSREGVRVALVSIPQRYMHTPVEVVDVRDVEHVAQLLACSVKEAVE